MIETLKTVAVCVSACIAILAFVYFSILEIIKLHKHLSAKRKARNLAKDEKKRIAEEKEIAYKAWLEMKAKNDKLKEVK